MSVQILSGQTHGASGHITPTLEVGTDREGAEEACVCPCSCLPLPSWCVHASPHLRVRTQCTDTCVLRHLPSPLLVFLCRSGLPPPVSTPGVRPSPPSGCPSPAVHVSLPGSGCLGAEGPLHPHAPGRVSPFTSCCGCDSPTSCVGLLLSPQVSAPCHCGCTPPLLSVCLSPPHLSSGHVSLCHSPRPHGACIPPRRVSVPSLA